MKIYWRFIFAIPKRQSGQSYWCGSENMSGFFFLVFIFLVFNKWLSKATLCMCWIYYIFLIELYEWAAPIKFPIWLSEVRSLLERSSSPSQDPSNSRRTLASHLFHSPCIIFCGWSKFCFNRIGIQSNTVFSVRRNSVLPIQLSHI